MVVSYTQDEKLTRFGFECLASVVSFLSMFQHFKNIDSLP